MTTHISWRAALLCAALFCALAVSSCATTEPTEDFCTCASAESKRGAVGERLSLRMGESIVINDPNICVRFDSVPTDSRCPLNAICVWPGNATAVFTLCAQRDGETATLELNTFSEPKTAKFQGYEFELVELNPYPVALDDGNRREEPCTAVFVARQR